MVSWQGLVMKPWDLTHPEESIANSIANDSSNQYAKEEGMVQYYSILALLHCSSVWMGFSIIINHPAMGVPPWLAGNTSIFMGAREATLPEPAPPRDRKGRWSATHAEQRVGISHSITSENLNGVDHMRLSINGGTPIAGWFFSRKKPIENLQ